MAETADGRKRVVIENVFPEINGGRYPAKRVVGETFRVEADVFADGHDRIRAELLYRKPGGEDWSIVPMEPLGNDRWQASFVPAAVGLHRFTVRGWIDHHLTWLADIRKKIKAGTVGEADFRLGASMLEELGPRLGDSNDLERVGATIETLTGASAERLALVGGPELDDLFLRYPDRSLATIHVRDLDLWVDRSRGGFSAWFEFFPRSCTDTPGRHGTFRDCEVYLEQIAGMGFDVVYLPPIHPIGATKRKGRNNNPVAETDDPGSPWAIGSAEGGHTAIHPGLGTIEDFERFVNRAGKLGLEVALDLAFQCSPDHPYVKEHPEWFRWRPDGTVQYAENPPKKYEDIIPLNFESEHWQSLWRELKSVVLFWIGKGVMIFRVDNPHTKSFGFWEWLMREIREAHPEVIFLSEAFTRPKVMYRLAKLGFTQSYTYFTWRTTKQELRDYVEDLTGSAVREFFRPNFWVNTPDILPEHLQYGGRPAFVMRLVLAATLSSNYGMYGPPFERIEGEALPGTEEYADSEKYEIKSWAPDVPGSLRELIARVNGIRREHPALQRTANIRFLETDNEFLLAYVKFNEDRSNQILTVVNLDPYHAQSGWIVLPLEEVGGPDRPYLVDDLLAGGKFIWHGSRNYVELDPRVTPAHIFRLMKTLRRETDFDYFM